MLLPHIIISSFILIQTDLVQDKFAILKYICLRGALL